MGGRMVRLVPGSPAIVVTDRFHHALQKGSLMLPLITCLLPILVLQAPAESPPESPPEFKGIELPFTEFESPDNHGGLSLYRFSPDGTLLAAGTGVGRMLGEGDQSTFGGEIILWDLSTGRLRPALGAHATSPTALAFSADGTRLLSYSREDHHAMLWSVADGRLIAELTLDGPGARSHPPALSPDGRILLHLEERPLKPDEEGSMAVPFRLEAWDLEAGRRLWTRGEEVPGAQLDLRFAITPDGRGVACASRSILWQEEDGRFIGRHQSRSHDLLSLESGEPIWSIAVADRDRARPHPDQALLVTPDGREILMVGRKSMHRYATADGASLGEPIDLEAEESVSRIHFSGDGTRFMVTRFFGREFDVRSFPEGTELFRIVFAFNEKLHGPEPSPDLERLAGYRGFSPAVLQIPRGSESASSSGSE